MRLPTDPIPVVKTVTDPVEVGPQSAVSPIRPVGDEADHPDWHPLAPGASDAPPKREPVPRQGGDRRKMCRRLYHRPVLLDTRSGIDRRQESRRDEDGLFHMSRTV